jgi:hypothetical protein
MLYPNPHWTKMIYNNYQWPNHRLVLTPWRIAEWRWPERHLKTPVNKGCIRGISTPNNSSERQLETECSTKVSFYHLSPKSYSMFSWRVNCCSYKENLKVGTFLLFINLQFEKQEHCPGVSHLSCQQFLSNTQLDWISEECKTSASNLNSNFWSSNCGSCNVFKIYKTYKCISIVTDVKNTKFHNIHVV